MASPVTPMRQQLDQLLAETPEGSQSQHLSSMVKAVKDYLTTGNWKEAQAQIFYYLMAVEGAKSYPPRDWTYLKAYKPHCRNFERVYLILSLAIEKFLTQQDFAQVDFRSGLEGLKIHATSLVNLLMSVPQETRDKCDRETAKLINIGNMARGHIIL